MADAPKFTLAEVVAFLCGEAPLDGVWFGGSHPTERGAFWWRKHLRAAAGVEGCSALRGRCESPGRCDGLGRCAYGAQPSDGGQA